MLFQSMCKFVPVCAILLATLAVQAQADDAPKSQAISPQDGVIKLFNGKDLGGLYTLIRGSEYEDPRKVFTVQDGMLHISGDGYGYIGTKKQYRDYHQIVEFKWGPRTWGSRKKATKDSGLLIHSLGIDRVWPAMIEVQIIEGGVGDFILVGGKFADGSSVPISLTAEVSKDRDGETIWKKGAPRKKFTGGRINWYGRDPDWKDVLGFRGKDDVESPDGQWTRIDVLADGGHITTLVNGIVVNEGFDASPSYGRILLQTEMAELTVRRWELWPLGKAPSK